MLKKARCTVYWRSIRDLNSGGATNALSHFECDPFDLLGNAPYVNLQKSFPEKGEKSRREQQILSCRKCADFNDNTMENQEEFPKCRLDFECSLLRLLAYICLFSSLLYKANRVYSIIPAAAGIVNSSGAGSWKIWRALCGWRCF